MIEVGNQGTSKDLAIEAKSFALKSIPTKHVMPATKAAKMAAYLYEEKYCYIQEVKFKWKVLASIVKI